MRLPAEFETFHEKIELGKKQVDRIQSSVDALSELLTNAFDLRPGDVFLQGSIPNRTAVKPDPEGNGGEYDVDLVVISADSTMSPTEALDMVEEVLAGNGAYSEKLERDRDRPCVRLNYADDEIGGFHVDVVPTRLGSGEAPLEIPRPTEGWKPTAPAEYTQWCLDQGGEFARTVQMLKRWRDHNQTAREGIKSILLQVLVSANLPAANNDADRVAGTLRTIADQLAQHPTKPEIKNPVLDCEVLSERWNESDYTQFSQVVAEAADLAEEALAEEDMDRSRGLWQELFGKSFPGPQRGGGSRSPAPSPGSGQTRPQKAPRVEWG